jgi:hypothetical protein
MMRCGLWMAGLWLLAGAMAPVVAADAPTPSPAPTSMTADEEMTPQLDETIARGLSYLARQQNADGSFDGGGPKVAMTGLSLMSFLAAGHVPDSGKHGLAVHRAIDYLLKHIPAEGYVGKVDGSRMYGQGIIALALAEAYGVEPDEQVRKEMLTKLAGMLKVILAAQDVAKAEAFAGGWRYEPQSGDSDLSLSGWNALALRALQNIGLDVPKQRVQRAVGFVLKCYRPEQKGFAYQPGGEVSAGMTGVGVLNLYLLDAADRPELKGAAELLAKKLVTEDTRFAYYSMYYATQAAYQAAGETWPAVWNHTQQRLNALQQKDGGWPQSKSGEEPGRVYATAMSLLTLSVPYHMLPIYQR